MSVTLQWLMAQSADEIQTKISGPESTYNIIYRRCQTLYLSHYCTRNRSTFWHHRSPNAIYAPNNNVMKGLRSGGFSTISMRAGGRAIYNIMCSDERFLKYSNVFGRSFIMHMRVWAKFHTMRFPPRVRQTRVLL